jgi:hypothetical protein
METETKGVQFDLPIDVHDLLTRMARQQRRSMSGQAITIIEAAVREWAEQQKPVTKRQRQLQTA